MTIVLSSVSVGVFFFSPSVLIAQSKAVKVGDVVRIDAPTVFEEKITGKVLTISVGQIRISNFYTTPPWVDIPYSSIKEIELKHHRRPILRGFGYGALMGGVVLGLVATNSYESCGEGEFCIFDWSKGELFLMGAALGAVSGGVIGALIGATLKKEIWKPVRLNAGGMPVVVSSINGRKNEPALMVQWNF